MTAPTITGGIRISPQLWAEFGLYAASKGKTRNFLLVDMIRRSLRDNTDSPRVCDELTRMLGEEGK